MDCKLVLAFLSVILLASAAPRDESRRAKRDLMESVMYAWDEMVRTLSNAGDAVVHVFRPTEKTIITKISEVINPTEKGFLDQMADTIRN